MPSLAELSSSLSVSLVSHFSSHRAQLALTAGASVAFTAATIFSVQKARQLSRVRALKSSIPLGDAAALNDFGTPITGNISSNDVFLASAARRGSYDEALILEQLSRNRTFLGDAGLASVRGAFVIVVGCGGVGSWAATMLVRSGVQRVRLIDFDQVTLSSLNRHAVATLADVGTPKVHALRRRLELVAPWCTIDACNELWSDTAGESTAERLLAGNPDFVVDAIDNIETKVALLAYCVRHGIRVVSSMGAGCKGDPTRVHIGDISTSQEDPLARSVRRRLRAEHHISTGVPVIFSSEKPSPGKASLLPLPEDEYARGQVGDLGVLPDFRVRILPVLGTMPAFFGTAAANFVLTQIAGYPVEYPPAKDRHKLYEEMLTKLVGLESRLRGNLPGVRIALDEADVGYVLEEVFRGKSVVSGVTTRLLLVRWEPLPEKGKGKGKEGEGEGGEGDSWWGDAEHRIGVQGVVVMTKEEAKRHEMEVLKGRRDPVDVWGKEIVELVRVRREEERFWAKYR